MVEQVRAEVAAAEGVLEGEGQVVGVDQGRDVDDRPRHRCHLESTVGERDVTLPFEITAVKDRSWSSLLGEGAPEGAAA